MFHVLNQYDVDILVEGVLEVLQNPGSNARAKRFCGPMKTPVP